MQQITNIIKTYESFRIPASAIDKFEEEGRSALMEKISYYTNASKPIEFVMLGYPMKSQNARDKVLGVLPDYGEQASMDNFAAFNLAVQKEYAPGIKLTIISDGYVFNDVLQASDKVVAAYEEQTVDMARVAPVQWYNLTDFYNRRQTVSSMRDKLLSQFGVTNDQLEQRVLFDPDVNALYRGMIKFMEQDLSIHKYDSNNQLHKAAKRTAREMMLRNEAYSQLVASEFGDYIRLSMHTTTNVKKFGFQLVPGANSHHSPWHSVVVKNGGELSTMHKKDAEAAGYQLVYKEGRPYYFETK